MPRSSSSDGKAASAFTPLTSRTVLPIEPPRMTNRSFVLANSMATFGAATGSFEVAITVGPFSREPMATTSVPSRAILARRFFETFTDAPACFICMRSFCIWATVRPE